MIKGISCGKTLGVLAVLLLAFAGNALADEFSVPMVFDGVVNTSATWAGPGETVYVSPYTATDTETTPPTTLTIYCLDWNHNIDSGQNWTADFLSLDPTNPDANLLYYYGANTAYDLGQTSPGSGSDTLTSASVDTTVMYDRYLEAAWLFTQIQNLGNLGPGNATTQDELNVAAWTLFLDANPPITGGTDAGAFAADINALGASFANDVYNDLQCAEAHVQGFSDTANGCTATGAADFAGAGWYAVTPDPQTGSNLTQEFLTYLPNGPPPVPEPQAIVLFGTLVAILGASRYRRQKRA